MFLQFICLWCSYVEEDESKFVFHNETKELIMPCPCCEVDRLENIELLEGV